MPTLPFTNRPPDIIGVSMLNDHLKTVLADENDVKDFSTGLSDMPLEIKTLICEFLCDHCCVSRDELPPLAEVTKKIEETKQRQEYVMTRITSEPLRSLCITSKPMKEIAQPVLFHFFYRCGPLDASFHRLSCLARSIQEHPELAMGLKSLSIDGNDENAEQPVTSPSHMTPNVRIYTRSSSIRKDLEHAEIILRHAKCLEELEIPISGCLRISAEYNHPSSPREEVSVRTSAREKLPAQHLSTLLAGKPRLVRLALSEFWSFGSLVHEVVSGIRELVLSKSFLTDLRFARTIASIYELVVAMPQLESFTFFTDAHYCSLDGLKVLEVLLTRKDVLRSIKLDALALQTESSILEQFTKLERLHLSINSSSIIASKTAEEETDGSRIVFPSSLTQLTLEELVSQNEEVERLSDILKALANDIDSYPKLKRLHVILKFWHVDLKIDTLENEMWEKFKNAGVQCSLEFSNKDDEFRGLVSNWTRGIKFLASNKKFSPIRWF